MILNKKENLSEIYKINISLYIKFFKKYINIVLYKNIILLKTTFKE